MHPIKDTGKALGRRGILAAAAAVVAGIAAKQTALPVAAAALVVDADNPSTGDTYLHGPSENQVPWSESGSYYPVLSVENTATFSAYGYTAIAAKARYRGVFGRAVGDAGFGAGVEGVATGTNGTGVLGKAYDAFGVGVQGNSNSYLGVVGRSGTGVGVYGSLFDPGGTGTANTAVKGEIGGGVTAANSVAVYGNNQASGANGTGVLGVSATGVGVQGTATSSYGVYGGSTSGPGVYGLSQSSYGGIFLTTSGSYAVLAGASGSRVAFGGSNTNATGYAAYFTGNVKITGGKLYLDSQTLQSLSAHSDGSKRVTYGAQMAEATLEDVGEATLVSGKAEVALDPAFAGLIATDRYLVFLTGNEGTSTLRVARRTAAGFAVEEIGAASNGTFSWRVVATPRGAGKAQRLATHELPDLKVPTVDEFPKPPSPPVPPAAPVGDRSKGQQGAPVPNPAPSPRPVSPTVAPPAAPVQANPTAAPPTPNPAPPSRP